MSRKEFIVLCACAWFSLSSMLVAQDPLREHRIKALKSLDSVGNVLRPNALVEVLSQKEINDLITVELKQKIPQLKLQTESSNWLELSYITVSSVCFIELSLYRWATVIDSSEDIYTEVWADQRVIVGCSRESFRETVDTLTTSFAADYYRANP